MTQRQYRQYLARRHGKPVPLPKAWSETEKRYFYSVLKGSGKYEGDTVRITPDYTEKHVYTPDFVTYMNCTVTAGGLRADAVRKVYHEVKGHYRLQSQDAARLRWCFAALSHPDVVFVWAKETRVRSLWDIEVWFDGGRTRLKERNVLGFEFTGKGGVEWTRSRLKARSR